MYIHINESEFIDRSNKMSQYKDNFSYWGKKALFQHLEEYESDTGDSVQFDYIAFCSEWTEYESIDEVEDAYGTLEIAGISDLENHTQVITFKHYTNIMEDVYTNRYIVRDF